MRCLNTCQNILPEWFWSLFSASLFSLPYSNFCQVIRNLMKWTLLHSYVSMCQKHCHFYLRVFWSEELVAGVSTPPPQWFPSLQYMATHFYPEEIFGFPLNNICWPTFPKIFLAPQGALYDIMCHKRYRGNFWIFTQPYASEPQQLLQITTTHQYYRHYLLLPQLLLLAHCCCYSTV